MHILLTDVLTCPRCGPEFGLMVLADRMEERRVVEGRLGCANCRESYPVHDALADLRLPGAAESGDAGPSMEEDAEASVRLAALMGLSGAIGMALVAGPGARQAAAVHALVPELEVIAAAERPDALPPRAAGVSRIAAGPGGLPLRGGGLRGAALTGGADEARLREGLRVLAPGARLLVEPAAADTAERLRALGAEVLLDQAGAVVARAPGRPVELRHNAVR
ncbi:MAG TPA: Trm112 family protein [Longimicrobium sp.]|nr:Trm112 family protein [Longimicrobium sp.]